VTYPPGATEMMREVIHSSCQWPAALQVQYAPVGSRPTLVQQTFPYAPVGSRPPPDTLSLSRLSRKFRQDAAVTDPTESETCVRWHRETSAVPCVAECGERAA
jgi:hypothetical protein